MQAFTTDPWSPIILIPAAGFGRRVGSPEAKELMLDEDQLPLIEWGLRQAFCRKWQAHVILREGKTSLLQYLNSHSEKNLLSWQIVSETRDWPETLLKSEAYWKQKNLVLLPDTRFAPTSILDRLSQALDSKKVAYATLPVLDASTWGTVSKANDELIVGEKASSEPGQAWGLIGFEKSVGQKILSAHLQSTLTKTKQKVAIDFAEVALDSFIDLTRNT